MCRAVIRKQPEKARAGLFKRHPLHALTAGNSHIILSYFTFPDNPPIGSIYP
jgi:hypothetical protein